MKFQTAAPTSWKGSPARSPDLKEEDRKLLKQVRTIGPAAAYRKVLTRESRLHRWGHFPLTGNQIDAFLKHEKREVTWEQIGSDIARSHDLGYTYGRFALKARGDLPKADGYYVRVWKRNGAGRWRIALDTVSPVPPDAEEKALLAQGYQLIQSGRMNEAVALFREAVARYPRSANARDSLADAYEAAGDFANAVTFARQALELLPTDPNADPQFREAVRASAEGKLKRHTGH
jgi:tetratricopeptide (TPR) repeat protein